MYKHVLVFLVSLASLVVADWKDPIDPMCSPTHMDKTMCFYCNVNGKSAFIEGGNKVIDECDSCISEGEKKIIASGKKPGVVTMSPIKKTCNLIMKQGIQRVYKGLSTNIEYTDSNYVKPGKLNTAPFSGKK